MINVVLSLYFFYKNFIYRNNKELSHFTLIIWTILGGCLIVFWLSIVVMTFYRSFDIIIDNTRYSKKKEYTIVKHTDNSKEKDVDIVILDKGSQIITMKGEVNDNELKIFTDNFEIRDSDGLKFRFKNFSNVVTASNLEDYG